MYKFVSKQIKFEDFGQLVGLHMNPENRWIKRTESIPWEEIEHRYSELFKNKKAIATGSWCLYHSGGI